MKITHSVFSVISVLLLILIPSIPSDVPANASMTVTLTRGDSLIFAGQGSLGNSAMYAGDVNADGFDDLIISNPSLNGGLAYLHFGSTVLDTIPDLVLAGPQGSVRFGIRVTSAGDVNNDGYDDVAVADDEIMNNTGRVYIYYGGLEMNAEADIVLTGQSESIYFGRNVMNAGDVNGDGFSDIIAGAFGFGSNRGKVEIHFGALNMDTIPDVVFVGENGGDVLGNVSGAGDVNNDGFDDVIAGAWGYNSRTGRAYILFGGTNMNNVPDVILTGNIADDGFGLTVADAGDVNGDSYSDVLVGTNVKGRAFIFYGGANMNNSADVNLVDAGIGYQAAGVGDLNKDGYADVMVGAYSFNSDKGKASVFYGGLSMDGVSDMVYFPSVGSYYGYSLSKAGDVNNDGFLDFLIGAPGEGGRAYLFYNLQPNPKLIQPADGSENVTQPIEFSWEPYPSAISYRLEISNDSLFNNLSYVDSTLTDTTVSVGGLSFETRYFWRIGAKDSQGFVTYSAVWRFTTVESPPVLLINPSFGSTNNPLEIDFMWRQTPGALSYRILVSLDTLFNNVIFIDSVFNDTTISVEGFSYATDYYWKVGAKDSNGVTNFSNVWRFETMPRPIVSLLSPMNDSVNTSLNMIFAWSKVPYASTYRIQLATDSNFINLVRNYSGITDSFKAIAGLNHLTRYFWRVGAKELSGPTYYSSYRAFNTMPQLKLNVTVLMEGMYYPLFNQLSRRDSVRIVLRESTAPYSIIDSATSIIDSLSYTGLFEFPIASSGRYYIVVKHFNSVETWSRNGGEELVGGIINSYNFTTSSSQAYGNNVKLKSGKYCIYSGDINQSGFIDGSDAVRVHVDSQNFVTGRYLTTDLNADGIVDGTDYVIADNNAYNFVGTISP
jgi:hypothetical protein